MKKNITLIIPKYKKRLIMNGIGLYMRSSAALYSNQTKIAGYIPMIGQR